METAIGYLEDRIAWFTTDELKWKRRIEKWAQEYPEEVEIRTRPEENDGCMVAKIPASWLRVRPPIKRNLSEEQRMAMSERMSERMRNIRKADAEDEEDEEEDE